MNHDRERIERNKRAVGDAGLDAVVCALPMNVLLLSGYWPVVGTSIAIFTRDGGLTLIVPEDEMDLAARSWADDLQAFSAGSLNSLLSIQDVVRRPLREAVAGLGLENARIGFELGPVFEPSSYAAMNLYVAGIEGLLRNAAPNATLLPATELLTALRRSLTPIEIAKVKRSCALAADAFDQGRSHLRAGVLETEAANAFRLRLSDPVGESDGIERCDGFTYCMSGENSYEASAAFQRSRRRHLRRGDLVLIHCNSYVDGFWTDITRTYCIGQPDEKKQKIFDAVLSAREAAIGKIMPGVAAKEVDAAARDVLAERGFGEAFVHGLGHAVGFHAIDYNAPPRLHPASSDVLEEGMVFNVEPAVYIKGEGGIRHCNMIAVTKNGHELLTPFHNFIDDLIVGRVPAAKANIQ